MRKYWISLALSAVLAMPTIAQQPSTRGETGLVGVQLLDSGLRLLQLYGNPDQMIPVGASGGGGGAGGSSGGGTRGPGSGRGGGARGGGAQPLAANAPYDFANDVLFESEQLRQAQEDLGGGGTMRGRGGGAQGGGGAPGGGGQAQNGGGSQRPQTASPARVSYVRWVYNRSGSRYSFILDQNNRVLQIEAIGMKNPKVRTRRGIGFGANFKEVIDKYQMPEAYQINGDTIIMRYLVRDKVAFRLNRLGPNQPHVVTAVVIAAGKT